jgi:hypothetical protein
MNDLCQRLKIAKTAAEKNVRHKGNSKRINWYCLNLLTTRTLLHMDVLIFLYFCPQRP